MDIVNFNAMIAQYGLLDPAKLVQNKDLIMIGHQFTSKRDGTRYREMAMTVEDFFSLIPAPAIPPLYYANTIFVDKLHGDDTTAVIDVYGDIVMSNISYGGGVNSAIYMRGGQVNFTGNITAGDFFGVASDNNPPFGGHLKVNGNISSNREAVHMATSSIPMYFKNGVIQSNGIGATAVTVSLGAGYSGLPAGGNNMAYFKDCVIINNLLDSSVVDLEPVGGAINNHAYFYNCEIMSPGGSGNSVQANSPATGGFQNTRANKPLNNVTDVFNPTGFTQDVSGVFVVPNF